MKVAVIGAAGYVGGFVLDALAREGVIPGVVTRGNGAFLLAERNVVEASGPHDVVINLAYAAGKSFRIREDNAAIVDAIAALDPQVIVHASSLAVFGFGLEHPVRKEPVALRADWPYVEGKLHFEHALVKRFGDREVHVVRLGNVWGPGSANWTAPIMNNVLYRLPTAVRGCDGYSNATEVVNAADFLVFAARSRAGRGVHFHHLAELYATRWSWFVQQFAALFGQPVEYTDPPPPEPASVLDDVEQTVAPPAVLARALYDSRIVGSYLRRAIGKLPRGRQTSLVRLQRFASARDLTTASPTFFRIMSCPRPFVHDVLPGWTPPLSLDASWRAVQTWIDRIELSY